MNTNDKNPGYENPQRSGLSGDNDYRNRMTSNGSDESENESEQETQEADDSEIEEKHSEWGDVDPQHNSNNFRSSNDPSGPGSAV